MGFDLNKVMLAGRLTADPVRRDVGADSYVCNFGIAINRKMKDDREEVTFIDIEVWGRAADAMLAYAKKGTAIFIEGSLKMDNWQTQDGQKRQRLKVRADFCKFTSPRAADDTAQPQPATASSAPESEPPF